MEWIKLNEDGEVEFVTEECKLVPEIQAIQTLNYNKGKGDIDGRKRVRAKQELKYLYLAYSPKSPYKDYSERERLEESKKDCNFSEHWIESPELKALIPKFVRGTQNKIVRSINTINKFLDKFDKHLNELDLNERNLSGGLIHNPKSIMQTLEELPELALKLADLERQARTDTVQKATGSKGDHELGWMGLSNTTRSKSKEVEDELGEE